MHGFDQPNHFLYALWDAQGGCCFHCDNPMIFIRGSGLPKGQMATREHVYPRATSGRDMLRNVVLAHATCNHSRGCREPTDAEITKAKAIYMILGLTPFIPVTKPMPDENQVRLVGHAAKHKWDTFIAPKLESVWPK